jgi:hypothetical protein
LRPIVEGAGAADPEKDLGSFVFGGVLRHCFYCHISL